MVVAAACLALAAPGAAADPGYTPIGPPATLGDIIFATDGAMYGTADSDGGAAPVPAESAHGTRATLWRSSDHGHTWSAVFAGPDGRHMAVLDTSPADPASVYVSVDAPEELNRYLVERVDTATGQAVALPAGRLLGIDAAGTAYLLTPIWNDYAAYTLYRCPATAVTCETVPTLRNLGSAIVDRLSVGLLASAAPKTRPNSLQPGPLLISKDGGTTWAPGATLPGTTPWLFFAGPAPGTLYRFDDDDSHALYESHDIGLSWGAPQPVDPLGGMVFGARPGFAPTTGDSSVLVVNDRGASTRSLQMPHRALTMAVDPRDDDHVVILGPDETDQTWDGGRSWSDIADARFGTMPLSFSYTAGAGRMIYNVEPGSSIWISRDRGATWSRARRPDAEGRRQVLVSRDDPDTAYIYTLVGTTAGGIRTRDGGRTWQPLSLPPNIGVRSIAPGDPQRLFSTRQTYDSRDGGSTWTLADAGERCAFGVVADATSPTGQRLRCDGWSGYDPHRPLDRRRVPNADGLYGSPDRPGRFAVAYDSLLGDVQNDWSWSPLLAPTNGFGPQLPDASAVGAWPAPGGTTFYALGTNATLWARKGTGRWWRLQHAGRDLYVYTLLDATHALVGERSGDATAAILDLAHPAVGPPLVQTGDRTLSCVVPWAPVDAATSAIAWLRDGAVLRGAGGSQRTVSRYDRGHDLACRASARTAWGSTAVTAAAVRIPGARLVPPRPLLRGNARSGARLRCSRGGTVDWLRDGTRVPGRHALTYLVRGADVGHVIACRARLADGTVTRSRGVRIRPA